MNPTFSFFPAPKISYRLLSRTRREMGIPKTVARYATVGGQVYRIQRYRPRIEGLFARIERWTNQNKPEDTFWRSISKDNITTWYGKDENSRIFDPTIQRVSSAGLSAKATTTKATSLSTEYKEDSEDFETKALLHERMSETVRTRRVKPIDTSKESTTATANPTYPS